MHPLKEKSLLNKPQWRTDVLPPKQQATQDADIAALTRPIVAADLYDAKAIRQKNLARLHLLCGGEPRTPSDWSWADKMRGGPADERTPWQRTAGKT